MIATLAFLQRPNQYTPAITEIHLLRASSVLSSDVEQHLPLSQWVFVLAALATLLHFLFNRGYGYFRDELYYAACGQHLAWGYVDHAPLVAVVSHVTRAVLGD